MAMAALCDFFSHFFTVTAVFFTFFLLEIKNLFRSIARIASFQNTSKQLITTTQFFKFLEETNPTISYTRKLNPQSRDCAVCLSDFVEGEKIRRLKCMHTFHKNCLDRWLKEEYWATCPLCRTKVLPDEVVVAGFQQSREEYDGRDEEIITYYLSALHGNGYHHGYF